MPRSIANLEANGETSPIAVPAMQRDGRQDRLAAVGAHEREAGARGGWNVRRQENFVPSGASTPIGRMRTLTRSPPPASPRRARRTCGRRGRGARSRRRRRSCRRAASWRPRAATRPSSSTTISSASAIVERRCATMIVVRPSMTVSQRPPDARLGGRVDRRRGVVEDQHARVDEQRARDREPLALAARERQPALADDRVVALRAAPR